MEIREREREECVTARETTALGCWRHALAPVCVRALACVCRYVCDSRTQHASVNVCVHVCVYSHVHLRVVFLVHVCDTHTRTHSFLYVCAVVHGAQECVCLVKYSNISVCCFCLPAALPL